MKFYEFGNDMPYYTLIWAENQKQAFEKYEEEICDTHGTGYNELEEVPTMDIDDVFKAMVNSGFDGDKESMAIGQIGELYKIITSKLPRVVLMDGSL